MVTNRTAYSGAAGVCFCCTLFLAGVAYVAIHGDGCDCSCSGTSDSGAGFRARAQERIARDFWSLCLYEKSALSGIVADRVGIRCGGTQFVGWGCAHHHVLRDLSPGDPRRRGVLAAEVSGVRRICAAGAEDVSEIKGFGQNARGIFMGVVFETSGVERAVGSDGHDGRADCKDDVPKWQVLNKALRSPADRREE